MNDWIHLVNDLWIGADITLPTKGSRPEKLTFLADIPPPPSLANMSAKNVIYFWTAPLSSQISKKNIYV